MISLITPADIFSLLVVYCGTAVIVVQGQSFDLSYKIDEEVPISTVVGNVGKDSNIYKLLSNEDYTTLRYRILHFPDSHNNFFTIVNNTGVLKTASPIDRELICFYEATCKLNVHLAAQTESGHQFYSFKVTVYVQDINDNSPTFSMSTMNVKIDEDAAVSTSIHIISATDRDILNNTIQRYSLLTSSDMFGLKVTRNLDDSLTPQLYVKTLMDRERQPHYYLKVLALDGGTPRRSGELTINVTLNDVNDNAPRFSKQIYDESVAETAHIGHRVMTLSASDDDVGNNGRITFRLGARQSEESFNTFRVVANTGDILTLRDLTPIQGQTLRLVVEAVDQGVKSQTAQAVVNIHVIDTVNNAPIIRMTIPPGSPVSRITENASPGFVVAHFMVEDADSGENGVVSCHLQDDTFGLQRLKESEYKVTVYSNMDRERIPFYDVTITCVDSGAVPMTSTVAFSVILEDANDNPPRFMKSLYRANISENLNTFILRTEAEDIDMGQNGSVTYRLGDVTPLVASYISLNPATGEVSTKQMLDHELFKQLDFHVIAADSGSPSLSSTARVIIDVIDQNDNFPRVPNGYYLTVPENRPAGTLIGRIQAIDPDEGVGGQIGYQLRSDNDATRLFNLTQNGELRTLKMFDRETKPVYDIDVLAWDLGENPQTNDLDVRIVIGDVNDHNPVFEFPKQNNKTVSTTLDSRSNTTVTYILASDQDAGENASLTYTIVEGGRDVFEIEPQTGRLFTSRGLYSKDKGTYTLSLFVRDNGAQPLSATNTLVIVVTQGNGTAAFTSFGTNEHIIIVAVLVGITIFIAIVVFLIVLRFMKRDNRHRRTKYTGGLPMEVKMRTHLTDDQSSDEEPWKNYDSGKRMNGQMMSGDAVYEVNDDIILFKLKMADQYNELEPEDKDGCCMQSYEDEGSNRNSVNSDVDCATEMTRARSMTRLATFHGRPCNPDQKEKVWRGTVKEKLTDEILSTGADSGRGLSEDGSETRSSVTDESGCLISPSHKHPTKHQTNYSRPVSGYDRPPFLISFQTPDHMGNDVGVAVNYGPRQDYNQNPRQLKCYTKEYALRASTEKLQVVGKDVTIHRHNSDLSLDKDAKYATQKKIFSAGTGSGRKLSCSVQKLSGSTRKLSGSALKLSGSVQKLSGSTRKLSGSALKLSGSVQKLSVSDKLKNAIRANGLVQVGDRIVSNTGQVIDIRLCSEPPNVKKGDKTATSYNKRGVQESGNSPPSHLQPNAMFVHNGRIVYGDTYLDRSPGSKRRFVYPPPSNYLQTAPNPNSYKQASCPQLLEESLYEFHSDNNQHMGHRSRSFYNQDMVVTIPSRSVHDIRHDSLEIQDDGNTTTTSGSFTVDHEELTFDLPPTDAFV